MIDFQDWKFQERLDFKNQDLHIIDIPDFKIELGLNFNTEIYFNNCNIECINALCLCIGKKIVIENSIIGRLDFYATYFLGGLEMRNCIIKDFATFNCGVHNLFPNEFIIDNCSFECYVDFFDVYFEGTTLITNNKFRKGTNLNLYAKEVKEGSELIIENNEGDLKLPTKDDPFF